MTSGRPERFLIVVATLAAAMLPAALACADEVSALLGRLARPAPDEVPFVEVRFSPLLEAPVMVSGKLEYLGPGRLARHVVEPYREDTRIDGEQVVLNREGEKERRFSLRRVPELRGLLSSFSAILSGDAEALRGTFELSLSTSAPGQGWTLHLAPKDEALRKRLGDIEVNGRDDSASCITMGARPDVSSVTVLGRLPGELPATLTPATLRTFCAGGP